MAEAIIISALLPVVFEKAATLIENQLGIVLGADVESELEKLQSTLSTIQAVLEDAEERQVTDKALKLWLSNLKDAAYKADDLLEDFNIDVLERKKLAQDHHKSVAKVFGCFSFCSGRVLVNPRMCRNVRDIVEKFNSLAEQRSKFHLKEVTGSIRDERSPTHSYVPESEVVGREKDVKGIVELLLRQEREKNLAVLPIVGMGGLGKTTLAQMVYNHPTVTDHFELRVWVSVMTLDNFSAARVAKALIETSTGSGFGPSDMDSLQRNLRKLIGPKRFLLVLDDVWNEDPQKWEEVKVLLTFGAQGSAVIVTTRSGIAASITRTLDTLWLEQLSEDDCWILFSRRAFAGREEDPGLAAIGRAIVAKCGRLPLAAKALGGLMQLKQEESEWTAMRESKIWDLPLGQSGVQPVLLLSYYHLPSHMKQCFTFCAVFPRGYEIEKETLLKLWMANGFIPTTTTATNVELKGREIFQALEQRSFFQNVKEVGRWYDGKKITTCRMHDLIHDLARSVAGNECCILDKWEEKGTSYHESRHMFVDCQVGNQATVAASKEKRTLRTLMFRGKQSDLMSKFWSDAKYLRALGLHDTGLTEFPISICDLRHLRYLDLSRNDIKALPEAISRLFNLQTLNLSACGQLLGLPNSIINMSSLMHLYLEGCSSLKRMPGGMGQLRRLQVLTRYVVGAEAESGGIGELKDLNLHGMLELYNLKNMETVADAEEANLGSKENLHQLDFDWGESDAKSSAGIAEDVLQALQPNPKLKQLAIRHYRGNKYPTWLMGTGDSTMLLSKLVEVVLADCNRCEHLPQLWQLNHLGVLEIGGVEPIKHLGGSKFYGTAEVSHNRAVFPLLRRIKLYGMPKLEEWLGVEGRPFFPHIAEMEIIDCPLLRTMPAFPSTRSLQIRNCPQLRPAKGFFGCMRSLERLEMESCDEVVLMLEQEDELGGPLVHLNINKCKRLMFSSPSLGLWKHFSSLQNLEIRTCDGLVIFPIDVFKGLSSLKRLSIHCCYRLTGSSEEEKGLSFQGLTALEELDVQVCTQFPCFHLEGLKHLTALKTIRIYSNHSLTKLPDFPESVQNVIFYNNWNLISLPKGIGRLPSLESLSVLNLHQVTSLPEEKHGYKALNSLKLEDCPRVTSFPVGMQQRLPSLKYLEIKECPDLERLCRPGGEYWNLISRIPVKYIGGDS